MRKLLLLLCICSFSFSFELDLKNKVLKCSKISTYQSRLTCFDVLVLNIRIKENLQTESKNLVSDCYQCHGDKWEMSTNGERLVSDMSEKEIYNSLLAYKTKKIKSVVMNYQMNKHTDDEIKVMSKFIRYEIDKNNSIDW